MKPAPQKLLQSVIQKIKPGEKELRTENQKAQEFIRRIQKMKGMHTHVILGGSLSRNTHLRSDRDIDLFVMFPKHVKREDFEQEGLRIGKALFRGHSFEQAYSEHPYIRGIIEGYEVEVVPSYAVDKASELQSSVDRSPFHARYIQEKLSEQQRDETRLLKQFLKGIGAYGADQKNESLPGYACELIILHYGNFWNAVHGIAQWHFGKLIDLQKTWVEAQARARYKTPLILIDPTDEQRNVAAALGERQFDRMVSAAQSFSKNPTKEFFFPKPTKPFHWSAIQKMLKRKNILPISIPYPKGALSDIVWGQARRMERKISNHLKLESFKVENTYSWTDESKTIALGFELESITLGKTVKRTGPKIEDAKNSERFLQAHPNPLSGPRTEDGRWVIEVERKHYNAKEYLREFMKLLGKESSAPVQKTIAKANVLDEKQLKALYAKNKAFAAEFSQWLKGKERWME